MTDRDALLAAILDNPADDLVRLAYADYLAEQDDRVPCQACEGTGYSPWPCDVCGNTPDECGSIEHGRGCKVVDEDGGGSGVADDCSVCSGSRSVPAGNAARAELIRCQIELAKWEACNPAFEPPELPALRARERELLLAHGRAWSGEVMVALGVDRAAYHARSGWLSPQHTLYGDGLPATGWRFERGFVGSVRVPTLGELVGDRRCERCSGTGRHQGGYAKPGDDPIRRPSCASCSGLGRVRACPGCGGEDADGPVATVDCQTCNRSGILPALAPRLARVPGITEVWCQDRVPEPSNRYPGWFHWREGGNEPESVPEPVFKLLVRTEWPHPDGDVGDDVFAYYRSPALATSALALAGGGLLRSL